MDLEEKILKNLTKITNQLKIAKEEIHEWFKSKQRELKHSLNFLRDSLKRIKSQLKYISDIAKNPSNKNMLEELERETKKYSKEGLFFDKQSLNIKEKYTMKIDRLFFISGMELYTVYPKINSIIASQLNSVDFRFNEGQIRCCQKEDILFVHSGIVVNEYSYLYKIHTWNLFISKFKAISKGIVYITISKNAILTVDLENTKTLLRIYDADSLELKNDKLILDKRIRSAQYIDGKFYLCDDNTLYIHTYDLDTNYLRYLNNIQFNCKILMMFSVSILLLIVDDEKNIKENSEFIAIRNDSLNISKPFPYFVSMNNYCVVIDEKSINLIINEGESLRFINYR